MFTEQLCVRYCTRVGLVRLYEPKEEEGGGGYMDVYFILWQASRRAGTPWSCRPAWAGCSTRSGATSVIQYTDCWVFGTWDFFWKGFPYVYRTCKIIPSQFFFKVFQIYVDIPEKVPILRPFWAYFLYFLGYIFLAYRCSVHYTRMVIISLFSQWMCALYLDVFLSRFSVWGPSFFSTYGYGAYSGGHFSRSTC